MMAKPHHMALGIKKLRKMKVNTLIFKRQFVKLPKQKKYF